MNTTRWLGVLGLVALVTAGMTAVGGAGISAQSAACGDPKKEPLGSSLGIRGYAACSDGATAVVTYGGSTYKFGFKPQPSGVCWKDSTLPLEVDIGAIVNTRKKSDAPGFTLGIAPAKSITTDTIGFGLAKGGKVVKWNGPIAVVRKGASGTFKDAKYGGIVNGKGKWTASGKIVTGSWSCKRVLVVPG